MRTLLVGVISAFFAILACQGNPKLPEPPQQHKPWQPDSTIPTNVLSAVETLFEQGFPDPRGCEYQEIELDVSSIWSKDSLPAKTCGWVLPSRQTNRFAICWNGVIYPVTKLFGPANLHADITNVNLITQYYRRSNPAAGESRTVFFTNALSTRDLLLLRWGETGAGLTNLQYSEQLMGVRRRWGSDSAPDPGPYLLFASDWAWALFDRTVCAYMRGDDALALSTARQLAEVQPKIEAECARRGFTAETYWDTPRKGKQKPYLDFLKQLPRLIADLERREKEGPRVRALKAGVQGFSNQGERIAALIRDLDQVQARQMGQPGAVDITEDALVRALIQEGDAAIEPLLKCFENDERLTRSVGFDRDFFRNRTIIPVRGAALTAIQAILRVEFGANSSEIHAYWDKYKHLKLEERWYAILNDDAAAGRWQEAAKLIIQPENVTTYPSGFSTIGPAPTNAPVRMRGEILRTKSNPSISELMAKRALELPQQHPDSYDLSAACQMGLHLAVWDAQSAGPVVRMLSKRCRTVMEYSDQKLGGVLTKLSLARAQAGDTNAFEDYAAWLPTTSPEHMQHSLSEFLGPLLQHPTNKVLQATAEKIFSTTNSAWGRLPWRDAGIENPASSALVKLPAFRRLLTRELERKDFCGSITWNKSGSITYIISNHVSGNFIYTLPESSQPTDRTTAGLRWCDWIALSLSKADFAPRFNPFAPVAERDEVLKSVTSLMRE